MVPEGTTEVRKTALIKGFTCSLRMEMTCFVVPNWEAALQSHGTTPENSRGEISARGARHEPNCHGGPAHGRTYGTSNFYLMKNCEK